MTTLVTTIGGASANAYISLADANQYHLDRAPADSNWSAATDAQKNAAILKATELMDALFEWTGWVVNETQALLWPRSGMYLRSGYSIETDELPTALTRACAEYAGQLLAGDRVADYGVETKGITRMKLGSMEFSFKDSAAAKAVPDAVAYLIPKEWYRSINGRQSGVRELVRA